MNRRHLALAALLLAATLSGCAAFSDGEIGDETLLAEQEYDWESNATATFDLDVSTDAYAAVIRVEDQSELDLHRESWIRGEQPVDIEALQFRFANGTVVNASHANLTAVRNGDATTIELPADNGSVGYTAPRTGKSWSVPAPVDGRHRVDLPERTRVGIPLLSQTTPNPDETVVEDDQMTLYWDEIETGDLIAIRYYLVRDLWLFGGLFALAVSLGIGGVTYYYRQIQRARAKREDVGIDVEYDGDDDPPPGMG